MAVPLSSIQTPMNALFQFISADFNGLIDQARIGVGSSASTPPLPSFFKYSKEILGYSQQDCSRRFRLGCDSSGFPFLPPFPTISSRRSPSKLQSEYFLDVESFRIPWTVAS